MASVTPDQKIEYLKTMAEKHPEMRLASALKKLHVLETAEQLKADIASKGIFVKDYVDVIPEQKSVKPLTFGSMIEGFNANWRKRRNWRNGE